MDRRPLKTRDKTIVHKTARVVAKSGITPNQISLLSILIGLLSGAFFTISFYDSKYKPLYLFLGALTIQLRLLCNLFDGMVAVEFNKHTPTGELFNEIPDRLADTFIILGVGFSVFDLKWALQLALLAALLSMFTAYIRALGTVTTGKSFFIGPMAKPQRMALLTIAALFDIVTHYLSIDFSLLYISLWIIIVGAIITSLRRLKLTVDVLNSSEKGEK